jgi:hypothetical protein
MLVMYKVKFCLILPMCFLIELQDVAAENMDSPTSKTSPLKGGKDVEGGLFESSSEDGYSESSEEGSPIVKGNDYFIPLACLSWNVHQVLRVIILCSKKYHFLYFLFFSPP